MNTLDAGTNFPQQTVKRIGGGTMDLGTPQDGRDWQMVVVYRGLHCPICKKYLTRLEMLLSRYHENGIDVVTVSGDPQDKAQTMVDELGLTMPVGYDLSIAQMRALGLYISDPRSPQETDRPFAEPGLFVINANGDLHIVDVSNAPFSRPDLEGLAGGLEFIRNKDYPIRGTHRS
ncbi:peroxiredoxin-like family protein [Roseovarius pelagicus]|uniref:AhpC/TSA family protein n=1 Tax=Roseovarius pelagicus TaxID=2980108 RepID=A0ABY6DDI3_9RHOB|nr:peroxiredoxin-like family protein [Roseovarius pelagicus]UXX84217.1 AhpC/TSA family protein [Roseovarius pelagicus]